MFTDRLYGRLHLPAVVAELARSCPLILRLREVRMPNVPFHTFPSFSGVSRYEHSLGVAHLATYWAERQGLPSHLTEALAIAALYHDSATPAFSHLYEEFLVPSGFDHEQALIDVISGQTSLVGAEFAQVFLGGHCLLTDVLPAAMRDGLSVSLVTSILTGEHPLGAAINGSVDLDNIDNVVRAVTAMGIETMPHAVHPYAIADALVLVDGAVRVSSGAAYEIADWSRMRRLLYGAILGSETEFRTQTAVRWAIAESAKSDTSLLAAGAWVHTEPSLVFDHLRKTSLSRYLIDRVRLADSPPLLFSAWTPDLRPILTSAGSRRLADAADHLSRITNGLVHLNYYVDKRVRPIETHPIGQLSLLDQPHTAPERDDQVGGLVGGIYLTEGAYHGDSDSPVRPFRPPGQAALLGALNSCLGLNVEVVSHGWVGGST